MTRGIGRDRARRDRRPGGEARGTPPGPRRARSLERDAHDVSVRRTARGRGAGRARGRPPRGRRPARGRGLPAARDRARIESARRRRRLRRRRDLRSPASSTASTWPTPPPRDRRSAVHVRAGGAVALPVLARRVAAAGIASLEFYVGIPGSVGGAVRMNAGGHGAQTADVIVGARVFDFADSRVRDLNRGQLGLGYRSSDLTPRSVVLAATFSGHRDDPAAVNAAHRRDRPLAARAPTGGTERRVGVHESGRRFRRAPDRRRGLQGRACRRSGGVREARELLRCRTGRATPPTSTR